MYAGTNNLDELFEKRSEKNLMKSLKYDWSNGELSKASLLTMLS